MSSSLPLLLEPRSLADQLPLDEVLIIDQSPLEQFLEQHIPGSVHLDFKRLQLGQAPTPGALPPLHQLSEVFSELGLTPATHVVALDHEGGGWAGRLIWVLDMIGHTRYSYLNGGIRAWLDEGLPTESGAVVPTSSDYRVEHLHSGFSLSKDDILQRLGRPEFAVWDARSAREYIGDKVISARGGHIPGAVNHEWTLAMNPDDSLRIRDLSELRSTLRSLGLNDQQEIATHCQSHHRSGFTYLVGKLLGLDIKAYAGSWAEWGNDPATPIATGQQPG